MREGRIEEYHRRYKEKYELNFLSTEGENQKQASYKAMCTMMGFTMGR